MLSRLSIGRAFAAFSAGAVLSACGGSPSATAPVATTTTTPTTVTPAIVPGVRIGGLENYPEFITPDVYQRLTAFSVSADGKETECTYSAKWGSSNPAVATIAGGVLSYITDGTTVVSATCGDVTGQATVKYAHYLLKGVVRDANGTPVAGADVALRRQFGFDAEEITHVTSAADGSYSVSTISTRFYLDVWKLGYRIASQSGVWNRQSSMSINPTLTAIPLLFQDEGRICNAAPDDSDFADVCVPGGAVWSYTKSFTVPQPMTLEFHTYWTPGVQFYTGYFQTRLYCGNTQIVFDRGGNSAQSTAVINAVPSCNYRLYQANRSSVAIVPLQYTVEIK